VASTWGSLPKESTLIETRCVQDLAELAKVIEPQQWNALLDRSASACIFLTWEWLTTWWRRFGAGQRILFFILRDGKDVVGLAPLMMTPGPTRVTRAFRHLTFLGQYSDTAPEDLDIIAAPGREPEVARALVAELVDRRSEQWDLLRLQHVLKTSPNRAPLIQALAERGIFVREENEEECFNLALPASWEEFFRDKNRNFKKRWHGTVNRLEREGELKLEVVVPGEPTAAAFAELLRLNRARWGEEGTSFRSDSVIAFHQELCQQIHPRGWVLLALMTVGGKVVAAKYDFVYAGKVWGYQGGWDPDWEEHRVGDVLFGKCFEWAMAQGLTEYDFLGGASVYKERWSTGRRAMGDVVGYSPTLRGQALRVLGRGKQELKRRLPPALLDRARALWRRLQ
jgi:CelD/BcsL family acetyltransferase involved in cellulose biosynthesis